MVFVYQGSGKKQSEEADICQKECKKEACAIQWCLSRNNYQEKKCQHALTQWKSCCERVKSVNFAS